MWLDSIAISLFSKIQITVRRASLARCDWARASWGTHHMQVAWAVCVVLTAFSCIGTVLVLLIFCLLTAGGGDMYYREEKAFDNKMTKQNEVTLWWYPDLGLKIDGVLAAGRKQRSAESGEDCASGQLILDPGLPLTIPPHLSSLIHCSSS